MQSRTDGERVTLPANATPPIGVLRRLSKQIATTFLIRLLQVNGNAKNSNVSGRPDLETATGLAIPSIPWSFRM